MGSVMMEHAATKADEKTGVATQIKTINVKCLYRHCIKSGYR